MEEGNQTVVTGCWYPPNEPPKGWVCPKCGTVNAPWMPFCINCSTYQADYKSGEIKINIKYRCSMCPAEFDSLDELLKHLQQHFEEKK